MAENKDKVKLEDTFSADEAAVKTTSENKEEKAAVREEVQGKVEADLATYKNKAEEAESKLATTISQYIRLQADFENFRRRSHENEAKLSDTVKAGTMKEFLPIVDNFEMALTQIKRSSAPDTFIQGVELLLKQFVKFLNDSGVTEIEAVGKPFDPHFHEAVMQISSDELEDDTVSMVLKKGYMYKDMVLRPSSVQVSHKP